MGVKGQGSGVRVADSHLLASGSLLQVLQSLQLVLESLQVVLVVVVHGHVAEEAFEFSDEDTHASTLPRGKNDTVNAGPLQSG